MKCLCVYFMFRRLNKEGCLVEAHLSVEESYLARGLGFSYWYGVHQRGKEIWGLAERHAQIPSDLRVKGKVTSPLASRCGFQSFCLN